MGSLGQELSTIHQLIAARYPFVDGVSLAMWDASDEAITGYVSSTAQLKPRPAARPHLSQMPVLAAIAAAKQCRVIHNIAAELAHTALNAHAMAEHGQGSSYTCPLFQGDTLAGFLFFDAKDPALFHPEVATFLDTYHQLISQIFLLRRKVVEEVNGSIQVAVGLARTRDAETGRHLDRVAGYSRIMTQAVAAKHGLDHEYARCIEQFAPLHDIGKVGVPDRVLLKPAMLDAEEQKLMRSHVEIGEKIIHDLVTAMRLNDTVSARVMRNLVAMHHERGDGSGYPLGLKMADIPIEARIVAVADVYDALSNRRPYKKAWTPEQVAAHLREEAAADRLDSDCVNALLHADEEREAIRTQLADPVTD